MFYSRFVSNDVMINTSQIYNQGDHERPSGEEYEMPPYCRLSLLVMILTVVRVRCEARVLKAWYGCAMPENASVA